MYVETSNFGVCSGRVVREGGAGGHYTILHFAPPLPALLTSGAFAASLSVSLTTSHSEQCVPVYSIMCGTRRCSPPLEAVLSLPDEEKHRASAVVVAVAANLVADDLAVTSDCLAMAMGDFPAPVINVVAMSCPSIVLVVGI